MGEVILQAGVQPNLTLSQTVSDHVRCKQRSALGPMGAIAFLTTEVEIIGTTTSGISQRNQDNIHVHH